MSVGLTAERAMDVVVFLGTRWREHWIVFMLVGMSIPTPIDCARIRTIEGTNLLLYHVLMELKGIRADFQEQNETLLKVIRRTQTGAREGRHSENDRTHACRRQQNTAAARRARLAKRRAVETVVG